MANGGKEREREGFLLVTFKGKGKRRFRQGAGSSCGSSSSSNSSAAAATAAAARPPSTTVPHMGAAQRVQHNECSTTVQSMTA